MRINLEPPDIEIIAQRVVELLKPLLMRKGKEEEDVIFSVESLAKYLQVDSGWVYKQVSLKTIPYFKSGKYVRFRKRDIDYWIEKRLIRPIPEG